MKIRRKISLAFVGLTALLFIAVFFSIYYFAQRYTDSEFYLRLRQRATIAAQAYLEKDELNVPIYEDIRLKHLQQLPNEKEEILLVNVKEKKVIKASNNLLYSNFYKKIFKNSYAENKIDDTYFTGILYHDNEGDFIVVLSAIDLYGMAKMQNLKNILITTYILSLLFLYIIGQYYAQKVLEPIITLNKKVNSIRAKNLHQRLEPGNNKDELAELTHTFNAMLDRLETSFEMQSNFVHNASHELKNPLTAIIGQTEVTLQKNRTSAEYITSLEIIEAEASKLNNLVNGLLELVYTEHSQKGIVIEPIRIDELLMSIKNDFDITHPENHIHIDFSQLPDKEELLLVNGSLSLIRVAIINVLDNAIKFSENGMVHLWVKANSSTVEIKVHDLGVGIPQDELKNIYELFFRGSNVRSVKGFGFGLPLSYKIINLHGGDINVTSEIKKGTLVEITLPNQ